MKIIELLKQRRLWAGLLGSIAFIMSVSGVPVTFDVQNLTDTIMNLIRDITAIFSVLLPIFSYFFPKKTID